MREPHTIPTTTRVKGEPCGCGKTITIKGADHEHDRKRLPCQSTRWAKSYNRRGRIEWFFGAVRYQPLNLNRGFFRMTVLVATGILLALTLIGHNLVTRDVWHTRRGLSEHGRHTSANRLTTGRWRGRPAFAPGASSRPTDQTSASHSPARRWRQHARKRAGDSETLLTAYGIGTGGVVVAQHDPRKKRTSPPDHHRPGDSGNRNESFSELPCGARGGS